jgi:hypothetical protein
MKGNESSFTFGQRDLYRSPHTFSADDYGNPATFGFWPLTLWLYRNTPTRHSRNLQCWHVSGAGIKSFAILSQNVFNTYGLLSNAKTLVLSMAYMGDG